MKRAYDPTEYLYLSARLRAHLGMSEKISAEKLFALSYEEAVRLLGGENTDEILDQRMKDAFDFVQEFSPDPSFIRLFSYPYDCQNLKLCLKYSLLSAKESPPLFIFGSVLPEEVQKAVADRDFSVFPPALCAAAEQALAVFEKSGDIQKLDLILDRAAFEDMLSAATAFDCAFLIELVRYKIDCYLLLAFCRMKELNMGLELFPELYVKGAHLPLSFFEPLNEKPLSDFYRRVKKQSEFSELDLELSEDKPITCADFQAQLDRFYYEKARLALKETYGAETVAAYLLCEEAEIKQIRKLLAEKYKRTKGQGSDG